MQIIRYIMLLCSIVTFLMMRCDKRRARYGQRRIPERMLFVSAIFGGALGGCVGMWLFRHKTRKWMFAVGFPLLAVVQVIIMIAF